MVLADGEEGCGLALIVAVVVVVVGTIIGIGFFLLAACAFAGAAAGVVAAIKNFIEVVQEAHAKVV